MSASSNKNLCPCFHCKGKPQATWQDVGDKRWYCQTCWDKYDEKLQKPNEKKKCKNEKKAMKNSKKKTQKQVKVPEHKPAAVNAHSKLLEDVSRIFSNAIVKSTPSKKSTKEGEEDTTTFVADILLPARNDICVADQYMLQSKKDKYATGLQAIVDAISSSETTENLADGNGKPLKKKSKMPKVESPEFLSKLLESVKSSAPGPIPATDAHYKLLLTAFVRKAVGADEIERVEKEKKKQEEEEEKAQREKEKKPDEEAQEKPEEQAPKKKKKNKKRKNVPSWSKHSNGQSYNQLLNVMLTLPRRSSGCICIALYAVLFLSSPDELNSLLLRICDHMTVCQPGQQQGVDYLYQAAGLKLDELYHSSKPSNDSSTLPTATTSVVEPDEQCDPPLFDAGNLTELTTTTTAREKSPCPNRNDKSIGDEKKNQLLERLAPMLLEYLDDHKERALFSAVFEPVKYVLVSGGSLSEAQNLDVHGQNWYLIAMMECLGLDGALPIPAVEDDFAQCSTIHAYENLTEDAIASFRNPKNFGKGYAGIPELKDKAGYDSSKSMKRVPQVYNLASKIRDIFRSTANEEQKRDRDDWAVTAKHLAFFFSKDFFVRRCFETLSAETKPEYSGFNLLIKELFQIYTTSEEYMSKYEYLSREHLELNKEGKKKKKSIREEFDGDLDGEYLNFCYKDEYYTELDLQNIEALLQWVGMLKQQQHEEEKEKEETTVLEKEPVQEEEPQATVEKEEEEDVAALTFERIVSTDSSAMLGQQQGRHNRDLGTVG